MNARKQSARSSLVIICFVLLLTFLDNTVVSVTLSSIQSNLSADVSDLQWIVDAYMLAFAVLMLAGGTLGDIFGRKKIMLFGIALFTLGSVAALLANSVDVLITGRVIMGIGAAGSEPGTLSLIRQLYPSSIKRSRAIGIWAAVSGSALALGPIIGGIIVGFSSWRGVFLLNVILGLLIFIAALYFLPESKDPGGRRLDWQGLIVAAIGVFGITNALILGENYGYGKWWLIMLFVISAIALLSFILIEHKRSDPVLPLKYFREPAYTLAQAVAFVANFGIFAVFFLLALYLQLIAGYSGYKIALTFLTMSMAIVTAALFAGRINSPVRTLPLTISGCLMSAAGIIWLAAIINPSVTVGELAYVLVLSGVGFGICLMTMTFSALEHTPAKVSGMAASTVNTFRELGGVFGVAVLGSVVNARLTGGLKTKLTSLKLPANFQSLIIYAITHGGNTPKNFHLSLQEIASHATLINRVTDTAYAAFKSGLIISLNIAGFMLVIVGTAAALIQLVKTTKKHRLDPDLNVRGS